MSTAATVGSPVGSTAGTVLITGTTSGVGLNAVKALVDRGWNVVTANRDPVRAAEAAERLGIPHYVLDYEARVREKVIEPFARS